MYMYNVHYMYVGKEDIYTVLYLYTMHLIIYVLSTNDLTRIISIINGAYFNDGGPVRRRQIECVSLRPARKLACRIEWS